MRLKGQVYSLIALMIALPLILYMIFSLSVPETERLGKIISDQEYHVGRSIEKDYVNAVSISGRRAALSLANMVTNSGNATNNSVEKMMELMTNGSVDGVPNSIMENNTLGDWRDRILSIHTGFNVGLNYSDIIVENYNGFNLVAKVNFTINVSDDLNISQINRRVVKEILISVENLEDPLYPLYTGGFVSKTIRRYPYGYNVSLLVTGSGGTGNCSGEVSFDENNPDSQKILVTSSSAGRSGWLGVVSEDGGIPAGDVTCYIINAPNAVSIINSSIISSGYEKIYIDEITTSVWSIPFEYGIENRYYWNTKGPGFFERLEDNLTPIDNGLLGFVKTPLLSGIGIEIKPEQNVADYLYFDNTSHSGCYKVRGLPEWFRTNQEIINMFGLTQLAYTVC